MVRRCALIPVTGGTTYTRYLPSLNLVFGLTNNDGPALRRGPHHGPGPHGPDQPSHGVNANIDNLASTDPNNAYFSASGGNAKLLPSMAQNYNLSIERYFRRHSGYQCNANDSKQSALCQSGGAGYVSLSGYFISSATTSIPNSSYPYDFSGFVRPT